MPIASSLAVIWRPTPQTSPTTILANSWTSAGSDITVKSQTPSAPACDFLAQWLASLAKVLLVPKPTHTGKLVHSAMRCRMAWPRALRLR